LVYVRVVVPARACRHYPTASINLRNGLYMGDPVCWLDQVCEVCGRIGPAIDHDRRCHRCSATIDEQPRAGGR
jgi:hypothetical protein